MIIVTPNTRMSIFYSAVKTPCEGAVGQNDRFLRARNLTACISSGLTSDKLHCFFFMELYVKIQKSPLAFISEKTVQIALASK